MKKLLTLAVVLVALAAFAGLGGAQERKPAEKPKAGETTLVIPPADKLTLSATKNMASLKGCPVTARLSYSNNAAFTYPGKTVNFAVSSGPPPTPPSGVTDAKSEVKRTVKSGQTVRAMAPAYSLTSNDFACSEKYPTK
jgi:hypothetical protein